jgi:pantoate--beta-alanine ligase
MSTVTNIENLQITLNKWREQGQTIAFVPTMGGLHQGHLSLIDLAKKNADKVVVSVFVNPTQFAAHEDLDTYPQTLEADLKHLHEAGVDAIFTPSIEDIYPNGLEQTIDVGEIGQILCGKTRPHFLMGLHKWCSDYLKLLSQMWQCLGEKITSSCKLLSNLLQVLRLFLEILCVRMMGWQ